MPEIDVSRLASYISQNLESYSKTISNRVEQAAKTTVSEMVETTKQRRGKTHATGAYVRSIASKAGESTITRKSHIWYVKKPNYTITHLINNGHVLRDGRHYTGDQHVTRAAETAKTKFEERVKEIIRDEGN